MMFGRIFLYGSCLEMQMAAANIVLLYNKLTNAFVMCLRYFDFIISWMNIVSKNSLIYF